MQIQGYPPCNDPIFIFQHGFPLFAFLINERIHTTLNVKEFKGFLRTINVNIDKVSTCIKE